MSKYVKNLVAQDLSRRLEGVEEAVLVNVVGLECNKTVALRKQLREKDIELLVVKNSLAKRATEGSPLSAAFASAEGTLAICWGSEDFISLAKEVAVLDKGKEFPQFAARGGVMDGESLTGERVLEISKWPNREEQLSILSGQILSVGAALSSQLIGPGGALASQIESKVKDRDDGDDGGSSDAAVSDAPSDAAASDAPSDGGEAK